MSVTIQLTDVATDALRDAIASRLIAFNVEKTGRQDFRPLILVLQDDSGTAVGGLWGRTSFDWLFVELLFVPESLRGQGIGAELMRRAEAEAVARGCHSAWLDTFEFQARGFYERLGFTCFGELQDYPQGTARYFLQKRLRRERGAGDT